jgi:hypothetical protein
MIAAKVLSVKGSRLKLCWHKVLTMMMSVLRIAFTFRNLTFLELPCENYMIGSEGT